MRLSYFDFPLPEALIALTPARNRSHSKLMVLSKKVTGTEHTSFNQLPCFLRKGDVLILNNTKVIPARLFGRRATGGHVEILLLRQIEKQTWQVLLKPSGKIKRHEIIHLEKSRNLQKVQVLDDFDGQTGMRQVQFHKRDYMKWVERYGHIPLPPYIRRSDRPSDRKRYQTVFAKRQGAIAAPTAGLHFTPKLLREIKRKGVQIAEVTLHVGYGTFQPISKKNFNARELFEESYEISPKTIQMIYAAQRENRRVIACGTTTVRALESAASSKGKLKAGRGKTKLFIYPPYRFKIVNGLITNFHLPQSSLLLLVAAFLDDSKRLLSTYRKAIQKKYRFYSYGDAMLIF